jgi:hypothetical protein
MSIPASQIVQVNPGVISGGGAALALNGVMLTNNSAVPIGTVKPFPSATSVSAFFGAASAEATYAAAYFSGRNNATVLPGNLFFYQYPSASVSAYLRGASLGSMTLTQLQAFSGVIALTINGTLATSSTINLSAATSFSNAATIIQAGFTAPAFSVTYDSIRTAFVFTTTLAGATATITFASGSLSGSLLLTQAVGAVTSQGSVAGVPATAMTQIASLTLNWAAFMTIFEPVSADKIAFAAWTSGQNNRFAYVAWTTDVAATVYPDTTTFMATIITNGYSGTIPVYLDPNHAAFVLGVTASIDFSRTNGRITYAFKYLAGLTPSVTDATIAANLQLNGYNFIGQYATANQGFTFFYPGSISGQYLFADEYIDQIYLNSQLQLSIMSLLTTVNSIPYNAQGNTLINAACMDPINQALNFGSIVPGVALSALQVAEVNNAAGLAIDGPLGTRGWYLQIGTATAQVRALRGSPPMTLWYMDGGSVQKVTLASILVQ